MGQVATKFTSDPSQLLAAYNQIYQQNVKLQQLMGQNAQQSKKQHDALTGWLKEQVYSVKALGLSYLTIHSALHVVSDGIHEAKRAMEELVAKTRQGQQEFTRLAVASGHAAEAGKLQEVLAGIQGLTPEQRSAAFEAVGRTGTSMSMYAKRDVVATLAPLGASGLTDEYAGFAGNLSDIVPSLSGTQLANLAAHLKGKMGDEADNLTSLKKQGAMRQLIDSGAMDAFSALGFEQAAIQDVKRPDLVHKLAAAADQQYAAPKLLLGRTSLSDDELAQQKLSQANAAERLRLILEDEKVGKFALKGDHDAIQRLKVFGESRKEQLLREYGTGVQMTHEGLMGSPMAREAMASQESKAARELRDEERDAERVAKKTRFERASDALAVSQPSGMGMFSRGIEQNLMWLRYKTDLTSQDPLLEALRANGGDVAVEKFLESENIAAGYEKFDTMTGLLKEIRDELKGTRTERRADARTGAAAPRINERGGRP